MCKTVPSGRSFVCTAFVSDCLLFTSGELLVPELPILQTSCQIHHSFPVWKTVLDIIWTSYTMWFYFFSSLQLVSSSFSWKALTTPKDHTLGNSWGLYSANTYVWVELFSVVNHKTCTWCKLVWDLVRQFPKIIFLIHKKSSKWENVLPLLDTIVIFHLSVFSHLINYHHLHSLTALSHASDC